MQQPRRRSDKHQVLIRTPRHILVEVDRIAAEREVSRTTVILDAVRAQLGLPTPNVFNERPAKSPPV